MIEAMVDSITKWNREKYREIFIVSAKILIDKGIPIEDVRAILSSLNNAALYNGMGW